MLIAAIVLMVQTVALLIFALEFPSKVSPPPVPALKPPPGIRLKRRCGISFIVRCFCTGGSNSSRPRKSVKNPGSNSSRPAIISDTLLIISAAGLSPAAIFCCISRKFLKPWLRTSDIPTTELKITRIRVIKTPSTCATWIKIDISM
ncbi:hypothetical protein KPZU09_46760 [Klebsiella pneumoniae]|uniref:Uncharacterized protein n=1 Tax=Klebsiella pneumoniae TaxID=573 RepID=A0A919LWJ6_KLEPN|nr:hypothetical protein KPZU09_46760 [Klebsiella pneumoniae]